MPALTDAAAISTPTTAANATKQTSRPLFGNRLTARSALCSGVVEARDVVRSAYSTSSVSSPKKAHSGFHMNTTEQQAIAAPSAAKASRGPPVVSALPMKEATQRRDAVAIARSRTNFAPLMMLLSEGAYGSSRRPTAARRWTLQSRLESVTGPYPKPVLSCHRAM